MNWQQTLEIKHKLEKLIKKRSMVFQASSKEEAALAFGKPYDYYYHFSYREWSKVSKRLVAKREKVMKECLEQGIPSDMPFNSFPYYREKMGL